VSPIVSSNTVSSHLVPTVWSGPSQLPTYCTLHPVDPIH